MSLVLAVRDKGRIVLGADKQSSVGLNCDHTSTKIWEVPELPGAIMGGVGIARASQILQYNQFLDKNEISGEIDTGFIINTIVPSVVAVLKGNGIDCSINENDKSLMIPNVFIFAYEDRAWVIWHDLSVTELDDYLAIGSGADVANGVLFATKDKNPFERIVTCIDAAAEAILYVDHGVDLLATYKYKADIVQIQKALSIEPPKEVKEKKKQKAKKKSTKKKNNKAEETN